MRAFALISSLLSMSLCLSCGERGNDMVVWSGERDNIEEVEIVSIDNSLPPMHSNTHLIAFGDSLIFHDYHDTGYQFKVYDIKSEKYVGEFGKFGNGPGEIANFGGTFTDHANGIMYGMNGNQWSVGLRYSNVSSGGIALLLADHSSAEPISTSVHTEINYFFNQLMILSKKNVNLQNHLKSTGLCQLVSDNSVNTTFNLVITAQ